MDTDELETRAALRRVAVQAAALHRLLSTLPPGAAKLITGGDQDAVSQLASRMLWSSTADLHSQGRSEYAKQVVARAAELAAEGMTQLRLVTNSLAISERFWRTIYPASVVARDGGTLQITPPTGPALLLVEAVSAYLITTVDMELTVDTGAADRLRAAGFDVAEDGSQAVDTNATDATIFLEVRP
ncbi:hypothetical protein [Tsukamurella paurometabola]|uniref:Uncharacterized protein n=1 Tax=Tsukamurella paurometabola TaxID=2061 RepID=A0ABS5NF13_TSUPA|nr:hypothetical protein [Tsukamurella paurometabola]MBS4102838.1 hypothetical protein [Tsukamurella paurometabola]